jgi:carbamate kinase
LDVLGAETQGMIGYLLEQELGNLLPIETPFASLLTMIEVDPHDPAFQDPTKFIGPVYDKDSADRMAAEKQWTFKQDGSGWRRVVPSPRPRRIFEIQPIRWLLDQGTIVICAGGGGIPTAYHSNGQRTLEGVEVVIDKDFAGALLARDLGADMYVMATDADGVYLDWGTPEARRLERVTSDELASYAFPPGSMGPKVAAACECVTMTSKSAAIGALADIERIVAGEAGTLVEP